MKKHRKTMLLCLGLFSLTAIGCSFKVNDNKNDKVKKESSEISQYNDLSKKINGQNGNIAMVTNDKKSDLYLSVEKGLERMKKRMPCKVSCSEYKDDSQFEEKVKESSDAGNTLVWVIGKDSDEVKDVANKYDEVTFALANSNKKVDSDNIVSINFKKNELSFFAGYIAALESKGKKVAIVCDKDDKKNICSFKAGVLFANKDSNKKILANTIEIAKDEKKDNVISMVDKGYKDGSDIVYVVPKKWNADVYKIAKKNKGLVIAANNKSDEKISKNVLLANVKCDMDSAVELASFNIMRNNANSTNKFEFGFSEGALDIVLCKDKLSNFNTDGRLDGLKETLLAGSIKIPSDEKSFNEFEKSMK